jgi:hypothetical protein
MAIKRLLEALDKGILVEGKDDTFTKDELTPVMIGKPQDGGGEGGGLPPPKGEKPDKVEVINAGESKEKGKKGEGEGEGKGEGSGKGKSGEGKGEGSGAGGIKGKEEKLGDAKKGEGQKQNTLDSHDMLGKSDAGEVKDIAEKILEKAAEARKSSNIEGRGEGEGGYMDKLRDLHKPKIDWANELRKKVTEFKSRTASAAAKMSRKPAERYKEGEGIQKSKSYVTYLRDPRYVGNPSKEKIIFKGPFVKAPISEIVLIVALDTSGSIGEDTITKVFSEMDKIAAGFKRGFSAGSVKLEGRVYFMTWDTVVQQAMEYKAGEWKQFVGENAKKGIAGRGGTDITSIFNYLKEHTLYDPEKGAAAMLNVVKKPTPTGMTKDDIVFQVKGEGSEASAMISPFLIIATDGQFGSIGQKDLGMLYKDNHKNILYLIIDGTDAYCYPKEKGNVINYESYRV